MCHVGHAKWLIFIQTHKSSMMGSIGKNDKDCYIMMFYTAIPISEYVI